MTQPFVITISSEKGGVGKTTVAINLAIFLKALREDLPVTLLSFDNHFSVDKMFRIGKSSLPGNVGDLFCGIPAEELVVTGEFGVQFIPSARKLGDVRERLVSPSTLAETLAGCKLQGVVIIDTRPDLDSFTQNAIHCADRVIIPVKDTPSLENSRYLFEYADSQQIPRQRLKILPCLVDFRIQYSGPFKDPHQLMKAYAINRGYRCFEDCISKSPKVESLNTNPEGKIFPVLTYGRGTDVHQQFAALAEELLTEIESAAPRRLTTMAQQLSIAHNERQQAFQQRMAALETCCPLCNRELVTQDGVSQGAAFYCEDSEGKVSAYLHEECVSQTLYHRFYAGTGTEIPAAMQELLREAYRRSYYVLRRTPGTRGFITPQIRLYRFDDQGLEVSHQDIALEGAGMDDVFIRLLKRALVPRTADSAEPYLVLRRVSSDMPESILAPEDRQHFERICGTIARQFPRD